MLSIKDFLGKTLATSPYQKTVKVYIICTQDVKTYQNEKGEQRSMKICVVGDEEMAIKVVVYDPLKFKFIVPDHTIIIRIFIPKGDSLVVPRNTKVRDTLPIIIPDAIKQQGMIIMHPPTPSVISLADAKTSPLKQRLSVQGKVIQDQILQEVQVRNQPVSLKNVTLKDRGTECRIALWRDNAKTNITTGDYVTITNLVLNEYKGDISLSSTSYTTIEKCDEQEENITATFIGYEVSDAGEKVTFMVLDDEFDDLECPVALISKEDELESLEETLTKMINKEMKCKVKGSQLLDIDFA